MFQTRLKYGLTMAVAIAGVVGVDELLGTGPYYPCWFVTAVVLLGSAALEVGGLIEAAGVRPSGNTILGGVLAMIVANWAPHLTEFLTRTGHLSDSVVHDAASPVVALAWPFWALAAVVMGAFVSRGVQFVQPGRAIATIAGTILAVCYVGVLGSFLIQFRWLRHAVVPLAALLATAKGADVGAYTLGSLAGRHKLWPSLSPNKTVEGAFGGLVFGVGATLLVEALARAWYGEPSLSWGAAVVFGVLVGSAAQLGDLMESMIKRDSSRKDASAAVPGFGGVLDVLDSLLFAAPVAFGFWLCFGT